MQIFAPRLLSLLQWRPALIPLIGEFSVYTLDSEIHLQKKQKNKINTKNLEWFGQLDAYVHYLSLTT